MCAESRYLLYVWLIIYINSYTIICSHGLGKCYIFDELHKRPSVRSITGEQAGIRDGGAGGWRELTTHNTGDYTSGIFRYTDEA